MGVMIDTIDETHGGQFSGTHARYIIRSNVEIIDVANAERRAA
jgi:hypothetical protein